MSRQHRLLLTLIAIVLAVTMVAGGCGSDADESATENVAGQAAMDEGDFAEDDTAEQLEGDDAGTDTAADFEMEEEAAEEERAAADDGDTGDGANATDSAATETPPTAADFGRQIIFTADITVEVDDVAAAGEQAIDIIGSVGGFVFGQQTQGGSRPESVLVFKVLPEDFDRAVEALAGVGDLVNQVVTADDVTERVVDLQTRIEVAELGVDRLRSTLETTQDLEDYAELERLLLERETELELMRGQLRTLQDRIDLATITLRLVQDAIQHSMVLNTTIYHAQDGGASCPGDEGGRVESGTELTICYEVVNTGEEPIADLAFIDTALGIDSIDDLILVYGETDRLDGGQSLMLAHELTADRRVQLRPKVTGRPITDEGESAGPSVDARSEGFIDVFEPEGDPGFGEGFGAGVSVLQAVWTAAKVAVGFLLPMLVLLAIVGPLVWFARRWLTGRRRDAAGHRRGRDRGRGGLRGGSNGPESNPQPPPPSGEPTAAGSADTPSGSE